MIVVITSKWYMLEEFCPICGGDLVTDGTTVQCYDCLAWQIEEAR